MYHFYLHWWKKWWFQANCDYNFSSILVGSPYHTRFQLWTVQVVSKERHTKQLMSATERKQHEMAHYLIPVYLLTIHFLTIEFSQFTVNTFYLYSYIYILCHLIGIYDSQMKCQRQPQSPKSADLQETPAKWWALLTSYMNCCSRLTQLTRKA